MPADVDAVSGGELGGSFREWCHQREQSGKERQKETQRILPRLEQNRYLCPQHEFPYCDRLSLITSLHHQSTASPPFLIKYDYSLLHKEPKISAKLVFATTIPTAGDPIVHCLLSSSNRCWGWRWYIFSLPHLAGIMSNLSTSFSKWREGRHNASSVSERSNYSMASFMDKSTSSTSAGGNHMQTFQFDDVMTPKVRKRKADDETVPFSASKK